MREAHDGTARAVPWTELPRERLAEALVDRCAWQHTSWSPTAWREVLRPVVGEGIGVSSTKRLGDSGIYLASPLFYSSTFAYAQGQKAGESPMHRITRTISVRDFNQNASRVLNSVREGVDIVPIRRGRAGEIIAYIVPAEMLFDHEALERARGLDEQVPSVEDVLAMRGAYDGRLARSLEELRDQETR